MSYKVVMVESDVDLKVRLDNLIIIKNGEEFRIPLNDIGVVVLDNLKTNLTTRLMVQLAEKNIGLIICDYEHLPLGYYSGFDNHSRASKMIQYQIKLDKSFYDDIWTEIVYRKIDNQAKVIKSIHGDVPVVFELNKFADEVEQGDVTNREAHAAKIYFNEMMGRSFSRGNEELIINSALDYGYAVVRAYIARLCVGYGLNTQVGIHHKNEYNRFNLVDDMIEPVRPIVDIFAYYLMKEAKYFTPEHRRSLANILNHKIEFDNKKMYLANMLEEYVISFSRSFKEKKIVVKFPDVDKYEVSIDEV